MRILAIDDNQDDLTSFRATVARAFPNAEVLTALESRQGFALAGAHDPDIILLALSLPAMAGGELCRQLKSDERWRDIPVVVLTTHQDDPNRRTQALEAGGDAFLSKPVGEAELIALTRAMVKIRAASRWQRQTEAHLAQLVAERTRELESELAARRKMEQELQESELRYRSLFNGMLENHERYRRAIVAAGAVPYQKDYGAKGYLFMGENIQDLIGYSPSELCTEVWRQIVLESVVMGEAAGLSLEEAIRRTHAGEIKHWRVDHRVRTRSGEIRWISDSSIQLYDASGRVTGSMGIIQDITERKRLEEQLRQAQKLESIGQLAGGVAHDFNNILAAILMQVRLLRQDSKLDAQTVEALQELEAGAQRAANLTRQLLLFSRRSVMEIKVLDPNAVIENLLKMLRRLIGEHIDLHFACTAKLPSVEADVRMLEQVLINLTVNARDAMPKGGQITIATRVLTISPSHTRKWAEARPGKFVCLSVADTGCGMDEATLKRVFEPFYTTKDVGKGTGLGLATVHGIVAQHKGWVEVESQVGKGTLFRILLPAAKTVAEAKEKELSTSLDLMRGHETLLVVEDEVVVRRNVAQLLRLLGYRVIEAANGVEALAAWEKERDQIDLLFTDMVLPGGITGRELADRFQAQKPGLKVIISSGYSSEMTELGCQPKAGIVYLSKPYEASALGSTIRACLS